MRHGHLQTGCSLVQGLPHILISGLHDGSCNTGPVSLHARLYVCTGTCIGSMKCLCTHAYAYGYTWDVQHSPASLGANPTHLLLECLHLCLCSGCTPCLHCRCQLGLLHARLQAVKQQYTFSIHSRQASKARVFRRHGVACQLAGSVSIAGMPAAKVMHLCTEMQSFTWTCVLACMS